MLGRPLKRQRCTATTSKNSNALGRPATYPIKNGYKPAQYPRKTANLGRKLPGSIIRKPPKQPAQPLSYASPAPITGQIFFGFPGYPSLLLCHLALCWHLASLPRTEPPPDVTFLICYPPKVTLQYAG